MSLVEIRNDTISKTSRLFIHGAVLGTLFHATVTCFTERAVIVFVALGRPVDSVWKLNEGHRLMSLKDHIRNLETRSFERDAIISSCICGEWPCLLKCTCDANHTIVRMEENLSNYKMLRRNIRGIHRVGANSVKWLGQCENSNLAGNFVLGETANTKPTRITKNETFILFLPSLIVIRLDRPRKTKMKITKFARDNKSKKLLKN